MNKNKLFPQINGCLLYTSDAADESYMEEITTQSSGLTAPTSWRRT